MDNKEKFFVVDGKIDVRFVVCGLNDKDAKNNAEKTIKKLIETGILGSCGYTFDITDVKEAKT
jgi:hypothetical protein